MDKPKTIPFTASPKQYDEIKSRIYVWVKAGGDADFSDRDVDRDLDLIEPEEKEVRFDVLNRLVNDGKIEKVGRRRGWFRYVNKDLKYIDFKNASTERFYLSMPLGLSYHCRLFPKSLIAISGEKNTGKSCFCLNLVKLNQNTGREVFYFSSEMLETEMRFRLESFSSMRLSDWNFHPVHRTENFEDVIQPDGINIIDFLEVYDEFWKIGSRMAAIFNKLKTGIAVVCVQKAPNQEHGRGGTFLIEKPRLTLSLSRRFNADGELDGAICTVTNCKFPQGGKNLNGMSIDYKIINGADIVETSPWYRIGG